nr:hypothetical protein [Chryseobacterium camelliae]
MPSLFTKPINEISKLTSSACLRYAEVLEAVTSLNPPNNENILRGSGENPIIAQTAIAIMIVMLLKVLLKKTNIRRSNEVVWN